MKKLLVLIIGLILGSVSFAEKVSFEEFKKVVYEKYHREVYRCVYDEWEGDVDNFLNWLYYNGQCY